MAARAAGRMAKLKELMNLHMTSANDAFRFVSILSLRALSDLNSLKFGSISTVSIPGV